MNIRSILKALILISFSFFIAACATNSSQQPTHYWSAKHAKTERDYKVDNGNCQDLNGIPKPEPMLSDSPSFEAYRDCMVEKGYVLRTYH